MNTSMPFAHYCRYLWERPNLIVVAGEAGEIWKGYRAYRERYGIPPAGPQGAALLERLFAAAGLAALSLPEAESWGWSVTFPGSSVGLFCGIEPEGSVCGQVLVSEREKNLVVVQKQGRNTSLTQSHFALLTHDPVEAVERYFEEAEQTLIRIAVDGRGRGVLLRPMPGGHFADISGLADDALIERCWGMAAEGTIRKLAEARLFYECPCNQEKIDKLIAALPREQQDELWGDLEKLEVSCPRCGRSYGVERGGSGAGRRKKIN
ncbi:MAG: Hsp33 family molecular chaperone HslO [Deltaproteobacteria bacterium]|nr:Hsp33 family molecular chaperone HslO [Deltaproteobacteria bacterium]